jgi:uncharacterized membrane protein
VSDVALSIVLGIGLAAATGFRVFLPMLIVSGAAYTGYLPLGDNFAWLGTAPSLVMLTVAAIVESWPITSPDSTICSMPWRHQLPLLLGQSCRLPL